MSADRRDQPATLPAGRTASVAVLSLAVAVVLGDAGVVTLALPEILRDFNAQVWGVAWVLISFNLVLALVAVPAARVCVRGDPAVATVGGLIAFAAATTVCAVAPSLGVLIAARAGQAAGGALVIVGSLELLVATTSAERAGVRRWATAGVAGAALGPVVGGALVDSVGWRSVFFVNVPIGVIAFILTTIFVPRSRAPRPRRIDPVGQVLVILALASLTYAIIDAPRAGWTSAGTLGLFGFSLVCFIGLVLYELRHREPLIEMRFFRSVPFSGASAIAVCAFAALGGFLFLNTLSTEATTAAATLKGV